MTTCVKTNGLPNTQREHPTWPQPVGSNSVVMETGLFFEKFILNSVVFSNLIIDMKKKEKKKKKERNVLFNDALNTFYL